MRAKEVMTRDVVTVAPETTIEEIARLLLQHHISGAPVVDDDHKLVGMVSEGDLTRQLGTEERRPSWWLRLFESSDEERAKYVRTHGRHAHDIMTKTVATVGEDTPIFEIAELLEERRIKRVPVVTDGKVVGIISRSNLLQGLATLRPGPEERPDDTVLRGEIERAVREHVTAPTVNVTVRDGQAHLWGMVESQQERDAARVAAENVSGVRAVHNRISVMGGLLRATFWAE